MSKLGTFALGGLGGLLPILVSLSTVDLAPIIDHASALTTGNYLGYGIRVFVLVALGGIIALLNSGVTQPLTLVQLGIAAPALVTSFINSSVAMPTKELAGLGTLFVSEAKAEVLNRSNIQLVDFLSDVQSGFGTRLDNLDAVNKAVQYPSNPAADGVGNFCVTTEGRFGPGPVSPLGSSCNVTTPTGVVPGLVTQ